MLESQIRSGSRIDYKRHTFRLATSRGWKLLWLYWLWPVFMGAQPNSIDVFQHLNLEYPGLERVRSAVETNDLDLARQELLAYFQTRTNRHYEGLVLSADQVQADQNVARAFEFRRYRHAFGPVIDWTFQAEDVEWHRSLNRFNWLPNLAGIYLQTGDEKYVRAWIEQVSSWISSCEAGYPRSIDTGRRLQSWVQVYEALVHQARSPSVTPEFNALILEAMRRDAEFLYQPEHWRRYSNWGTFENSGLSLLAILFPEFKRSEDWLHEVWFRMRTQLGESYHPDGMHIEVSPSYHSHELEVWFNFIRMAEMNGVTSPLRPQLTLQPLQELFDAPSQALMHFYKPTGVVPQVGDTDERDERNLLRQMGKYWNRPDMVYVATSGMEGTPPARTSSAFPEGGYFIMRSGWGEGSLSYSDELFLLFDVGTNEPWHAHYDMFNVVATAYGHDLLKDAGRFTYTAGTERDYFKSTAAHNTIVIDQTDQPKRYTPPKGRWHSLAGFDYAIGSQSSHPQITHQRSVLFVKPRYWIVVDRLRGSGKHRYDQYWHLSDGALGRVNVQARGRRITTPHLILLSPDKKAQVKIEEGAISYRYRQQNTAPVVRYTRQGKPPISWPTVLYPFQSEPPELEIIRFEVDNQDLSGVVILKMSNPSGTDFFFEQDKTGNPVQLMDVSTDAKMVLISSDGADGINGFQMAGGSYLSFRGKELVHIVGIRCDISVQNSRVEIEGDCLFRFQLEVQGTPDIFLNGQKVDVLRVGDKVRFSRSE